MFWSGLRCAAIAGALLGFFATAARGAVPDLDLAVNVQIVNHAEVPDRDLRHARDHAQRVFGAIGVAIVWHDAFVPSTPDRVSLTVLLCPPAMSASKAVGDSLADNVLGSSAPGTGRAWVFYDRIVAAARLAALDPALALARVLTHEIGHLLLPQNGHSLSGAMRPTLDTATVSVQRFTAHEGRAVRASLEQRRLDDGGSRGAGFGVATLRAPTPVSVLDR
jgi:hypothetical protein